MFTDRTGATRSLGIACAVLVSAGTALPGSAATPVSRPATTTTAPTRPGTTTAPKSATMPTATTPVSAYTVLHSFTGADGAAPYGSLLQDGSGNIYGVTQGGGTNSQGTIFKSTPGGAVTTLYSFTGGNDGSQPGAGVVNSYKNAYLNGNLYGVTLYGGSSGQGTVFKMNQSGSFTTLYSFTGNADGGTPVGRLLMFVDGNLYGTTSGGGTYGFGTIFRITPTGQLTTLYSFTGGTDGGNPIAGLTGSSNAGRISPALYGVTQVGGTLGGGTVFSISATGKFTVLHQMNPNVDGADPSAELVSDESGNLFGTAYAGGTSAAGTIFAVAPTGAFKLLYTFPVDPVTTLNPKGAQPLAKLAFAMNGGVLYGTASNGGATGAGVVFKLTAGTTIHYTVLHNFTGDDGQTPAGQLINGINGSLYGTALSGGANGNGVLFVLPH